MNQTLIKNGILILPGCTTPGEILIENGIIRTISIVQEIYAPDANVIDANGQYISPGFVDIHTHGAGGYDFMDITTEAMYGACRTHMKYGTTSILPTTVTSTKESLFSIAEFIDKLDLQVDSCPEILGLHLEGPYFSISQKGAQDERFLRNPAPEEYEGVCARTSRVLRWSFAVELPGADQLTHFCNENGIVASLAHSDATCSETIHAYRQGIQALTHFYSCMPSVRRVNAYRVAGAVEAGYLLDDLYVEVIADGCHLPYELLQLIYKVKPSDRICLVTDSCRAAGMPEGEYILGSTEEGTRIIVEDGVAKLPDRTAFAGSVATMDRLVRTFHKATNAPLHEVIKMASLNPARLVGADRRKGSLEAGKDADILILDCNLHVTKVMVRGNLIKEI